MPFLRVLAFKVIGLPIGIGVAVYIAFSFWEWIVFRPDGNPLTSGRSIAVLMSAVLAGRYVYYRVGQCVYDFVCLLLRTESHAPLSPDAEKDARGKFLPSSDQAVDDVSIQPDKRGLKPGGR